MLLSIIITAILIRVVLGKGATQSSTNRTSGGDSVLPAQLGAPGLEMRKQKHFQRDHKGYVGEIFISVFGFL